VEREGVITLLPDFDTAGGGQCFTLQERGPLERVVLNVGWTPGPFLID
jgi:hypothetical protein